MFVIVSLVTFCLQCLLLCLMSTFWCVEFFFSGYNIESLSFFFFFIIKYITFFYFILFYIIFFFCMRHEYQDQQLNRSKWAWIRWFGFDQFQPERAVTSHWIPTEAFLGIRILTVLYSTVIQWASIAKSALQHSFNIYFGYFTNLTFIGLHAYLVVSMHFGLVCIGV